MDVGTAHLAVVLTAGAASHKAVAEIDQAAQSHKGKKKDEKTEGNSGCVLDVAKVEAVLKPLFAKNARNTKKCINEILLERQRDGIWRDIMHTTERDERQRERQDCALGVLSIK